MDIQEAKSRLPLRELARSLGFDPPEKDGSPVSCWFPERHANEDRKPSFNLFRDRFNCFGCGAQGDGIDLLAELLRLDRVKAVREYKRRAGGIDAFPIVEVNRPKRKERKPWPELRPGTVEELETLARLRGLDVHGLALAEGMGVLRFGHVCGRDCWLVTDSTGRLAEARRMDGEPFPEFKSLPERKPHCLPGSSKGWPVGLLPDHSNPALVVEAADMDSDPWLVGVKNGTLDLRSGRFFPAERGDLITRSLGTRWDERAECLRWKRFLAEVTLGDAELVEYIRRAIGYTLTGETREQCFFFQWGSGANGKSVLGVTLETLLGDYCHRASAELFDKRHDRNKGPELAEVAGARLILASETQEGGRLDERLVKDITGGEKLRAEAKFCAGFDFRPQGKIWMSGNHKPRITGTDNGIWRRVRLIPFEARFEGERCNPNLAAELREELPGILRWAVGGCLAWQEGGLELPEKVKLAVAEYRSDEDELGAFIADCIEEAPEAATCLRKDVFDAYAKWAAAEGIRHPMTQKQLSRKLKDRGWTDLYGKYWRGVRIVEEVPEEKED